MHKSGLLAVFFCCLVYTGWSQPADPDKPDSVFAYAKRMAAQENYSDAIYWMRDLQANYPNADYAFFLAQLYYRNFEYIAAYSLLLELAESQHNHADALELLVRVANQTEQFAECVQWCETGKTRFPDRTDFYCLQEAIALSGLNEDEKALAQLDEIPKNSTLRNDAVYCQAQILKAKKNYLSVGYLQTRFDDGVTGPTHLAHLEYRHRHRRNTYVGRVNYGNLYGISALQAEFDLYSRFKKGYLYTNAGFSDGKSFFPHYRSGAEYFFEYEHIATSAGLRFLDFKTQQVLLLTTHLAWTARIWRTTYRPYAAYQNNSWFFSHVLNVRYTLPDFESYIQLDLQYGGMPYYFFVSDGFDRISAYRAGINCEFRIWNNYFVRPVLMYEREEYYPDLFRNRYNVQLILSKRF